MANLFQLLPSNSSNIVVAALLYERFHLQDKKKKRAWRRQWLARRENLGVASRLLQELALEDTEGYRQWMRLDKHQFQELLKMIEPTIRKQDTRLRKAVAPEVRLAITMRYLATGESQTSLAYQFRVSQNLISSIIPEVCQAIYNALQPLYVVVPRTEEKWKEVAQGFNTLWNFPLCVGALDGKRVLIQKPANSGSLYFDYKGDFSIILMALVDSDYKFLYIDVGTNGRGSDAGVWSRCSLSAGLENNSVSLPPPEFLPNSSTESPYVIVGDDAFPLKTYLMKPYPGLDQPDEKRIFNYRLSRARRVSENAFGILVSRFQIFRQPIRTSPECVTKIVLASVALHNYLRVTSRDAYAPADGNENTSSGHHRGVAGVLQNFQAVPRRPARDAVQVRQKLMAYFNSVGTVPWQREMAHLH